jgi:YggT family protein
MNANLSAALFHLLIQIPIDLYLTLVFCRFWFQYCRIERHHPLARWIFKATQPLIQPLQYIIPRFRSWDTPALFLLFIVQACGLLIFMVSFSTQPITLGLLPAVLMSTLKSILLLALNLFTYAIIISALLSWLVPAQQHPLRDLIAQCTRPLLRPLQRILPVWQGMDFSALLTLLLIQVCAILITALLPG